MKKDFTIIGNAVIDVLAKPAGAKVFEAGSWPVEQIKLAFGGDALNEAIVLTRLGKKAELITKVGNDEAGSRVLNFLEDSGLSKDKIIVENGIDTSVNIVLIDEYGERHFLTNPAGSQRKLAEEDVYPYLDSVRDIVSFASMFVSPLLDIPAVTRIFKKIKEKPDRTLVMDLTKAKKGERLEDMEKLLPYIDYALPNEDEISLLTGISDPHVNAELLIESGVSCAVIKCGSKGCLIRTREEMYRIPAYPVKNCVDTTGAGDSFAAGFLWALSEGMPLMECGCFACATASCTVECIGAATGVVSLEIPLQRCREIKETREKDASPPAKRSRALFLFHPN